MEEQVISSLEDLKSTTNKEDYASSDQQKLDSQGRAYATGKRKNSVARVWLKPGKGKILVNSKEIDNYFPRDVLKMIVKRPFDILGVNSEYDIVAYVKGGGLSGQAGALKHGISVALTNYNPDFRPNLRKAGFLTRDSRVVERKKYGKPKARKSFQFSKR